MLRWLVPMLFAPVLSPLSLRAQAPVTAFVDVSVIPMDRERVLTGQTVVVRGQRIVALGPVNQVQVPAGALRVEGRGKFLLPGLADMHAHLKLQEGWVEDLLFLYLANGITTVREMHSDRNEPRQNGAPGPGGSPREESPIRKMRALVETGELLGPRIYTAGDPDDQSPEAAAKTTEELKADGYDFVKDYAFPGPVSDSVVAAAQRVHLRVVGHVPVDHGVEWALDTHWASIEHLTGYFEYIVGLNSVWRVSMQRPGTDFQKMIDTIAWLKPTYHFDQQRLHAIAAATQRNGVWNCPTLSIYMSFVDTIMDFGVLTRTHPSAPAFVLRDTSGPGAQTRAFFYQHRRFMESAFQTTKALHDAGAGLLLGTDAPGGVLFNGAGPQFLRGFAIQTELRLLVTAGLSPYQALETGTRNVAAFLGTLDSTGTVAVGKRADLVLLDGNPLQDIGYTAGPAGVMVAGRWLSRADIDARLDAFQNKAAAFKGWDFEGRKYLGQARSVVWWRPGAKQP